MCLGTERGLETRLVPLRGYELALIPPVPLPRQLTPQLLGVPGRLSASVAAAARVLDQARADVLVGFGGYVATPGYLAARRHHVPIVVHEANARPGLANRIGARFTTHVFTGQPDTKLPHASYIGIPLRHEIASLDRLALADKARAHFGLRPDLPVLLVTGGSQGARSLNYAVLDAADSIRAAGIQVLHILGPRSDIDVRLPVAGPPYITLPYVDRMDLAYAAADFAICRSGAMTCAELTAVGLPAAYVPLPHGNGEQRLNAVPIEAAGGGLIIADAELSPEWIRSDLLPILVDAQLVAAMSQAASAMGHRDTDTRLAAEVLGIVRDRAHNRSRGRGGAGHAGGPAGPVPAGTGPAGGGAGREPAADEDGAMGLVTPVDPVPVGQLGRVHFTGIGGAGMSGIARIMLARGVRVSGSDAAGSALLDELAVLGADIRVGHDAANVAGADTLVVSTAIRPDNPELAGRAPRRAAGAPPRGRAGLGDAGPADGGGGRHARQDHDHVHADHRAAGLRGRPVLRDRRHPDRDRPRRGRGQRRAVRGRGR